MNKKLLITGLCSVVLSFSIMAQTNEKMRKGLEKVRQATKVDNLQRLSQTMRDRQAEAFRIADIKGWKKKLVGRDGKVAVLSRVNKIGDSYHPIYLKADNSGGTNGGDVVTKTNALWPGGSLGLNLTGSGMKVALWDGGPMRSTHQEFGSRATLRETGDTGDHATHVAGTIAASGVDASAKGMAYQADIHSFSFYDGDDEIAIHAGEFLVSNHSYGAVAGWSYGQGYFGGGANDFEWVGDPAQFENYAFGWYDSGAAEWDEVATNAPYYLIVKSAGNSHNFDPYYYNFPSTTTYYYEGGSGTIGTSASPARAKHDAYDLVATSSTAKNILTVGNVDYEDMSNIIISNSSSWGGADDGRIKPDISTKGTNVYSTTSASNTSYGEKTGTSMSAPMTTGSLLLLQQHYNNVNSAYMRSATLKALVINTADEAGANEGPDYKFGWGLLNSKTAAETITNNGGASYMSEESLSNGGSYSHDVTVDGTEPLKVTIVWTDPKGTPITSSTAAILDNRTKMLVNDLDIRITNGGSTYFPYQLDILNPANAATKGDNDTDNVEQVYIAAPSAGTYTITVTHKGSLASAQAFSVIANGLQGTITPPVLSCSSTVSTFPYSESFESGTGLWSQVSGDDLDWTRQTGATGSSNTGPSSANDGSYYMYVEASSPNYPSKTTYIEGPCFNLSGESTASLSFDYHMYGAAMGSLTLEATTDGSNWTNIWSLSGNQGNSWSSANVDLTSYLGSTFKLRFNGTTGSSYTSDMSIDNLNLSTGGSTGGGSCTAQVSSFPYSEGFENGTGLWTQASGDDLDWSRQTGATGSGNTGPSSANEGSYYMYVEASSPNYPSKTTIFNGPCFDLTGESTATFGFDYHMYGAAMGSLTLEASTDDGANWTNIWSLSGNQGNSWTSESVDMASYTGGTVKLRYVGVTGSSYTSDMSVDNLSLSTSGGSTGGGTSDITLTLVFDDYPEETSWTLKDNSGSTVASGGTYGSQADRSTLVIPINGLSDGCYDFTINDQYGDGMCCSYGNGSYSLTNNATGATLASGAQYTNSENTNFCLTAPSTSSENVPLYTQENTPIESLENLTLSFELFPNPAKDILNVKAINFENNSKVTIYDMTGAEKIITSVDKINVESINISSLKPGLYFITIYDTSKSKLVRKKFIKR